MIEKAKWIACGEAESPRIRKILQLKNPKSGRIEVTGLGFFRLYVNGTPLFEGLAPCLTDYCTRPLANLSYPLRDTFTHRICYLTFDLTPYLQPGENTLELHLGSGWYRQTERLAEGELEFGHELPAVFAGEIEDEGGSVTFASDGTEEWKPSFVTYSQLFIGEVQDASLIDKENWQPVSLISPPDGELQPQTIPIDTVVRTVTPTLLWQKGDSYMYDMGENHSAIPYITTCGRVRLTFAEELFADGTLDTLSTGADMMGRSRMQVQRDEFIGDGVKRTFAPRFCWHAFRYCLVEGQHESLTFGILHADVKVTSEFESASEGLNFLYDAYLRTQLSNMHLGVPSDCPHRERLGYTGDGQACCETVLLLTDSRDFYRKWIRDILDCQDTATGHVQHTAPFMGGGGGPCGWGGAIVEVPYRYWRQYGEKDILAHCLPAMEKWLSYIESRSENGLVVREAEGGWCLGDWAAIHPMTLPEPFVNTCLLANFLDKMAEMTAASGGDDTSLRCKAEARRAAVQAAYYDPATGSYCAGDKGADALALYAGLTDDPRTGENLVARYRELGYVDCGFLALPMVIDELFRLDGADAALPLLESEKAGCFGYMKKMGATTIWEYMHGMASHSHPMFGACTKALFQRILGIGQAEGSCAFEKLTLAPILPRGLAWAKGSILTPAGRISVGWQREGDKVRFTVELPAPTPFTYGGDTRLLPAGASEFIL